MEKSVPRPILPRPEKFAYIFIGASLSRHQVEAKDKKRSKARKNCNVLSICVFYFPSDNYFVQMCIFERLSVVR